jgi:hypothetical protein
MVLNVDILLIYIAASVHVHVKYVIRNLVQRKIC